MKRTWIVTVIGDLSSFKRWHRNVSIAPEIKQPFMKKYFKAIEDLAEQYPGQLKIYGDGFVFLIPIISRNGQRQAKIIEILNTLKVFTSKIIQLIKECEWPPEGFRLRTTAGYADEYIIGKNNETEYISDLINLCQQLLHIRPEIPLVCHITTVKPLSDKAKEKMRLSRVIIKPRDVYRVAELIDANDIKDLFEVPLK